MSGGYEVQPDTLDSYAQGLGDRAGRIGDAAERVGHLNGGDINAFGVAVGQVLGVPTRIALGVLGDQVKSAGDTFNREADKVRKAAETYRTTDADHAQTLKTEGQ